MKITLHSDAVHRTSNETNPVIEEAKQLQPELDLVRHEIGFVAFSPQSMVLAALIRRVAPTSATCLIEGESGTGKELVARLLHHWSQRRGGPFVAVNCKAIPEGLVESELFGHERGAFTGAISERLGCFERASGGTLFLDEIGEADGDFQTKLLRVLETGEVTRVGGSRTRHLDVRVVAASNKLLRKEMIGGRFREDLFFRLNVIPLRITPLRERPEDIAPLARHFLARYASTPGASTMLPFEVEHALLEYRWPGNVRELENAIERAIVMSGGAALTPQLLGLDAVDDRESAEKAIRMDGTLQETIDEVTAIRIRHALKQARGNQSQAAAMLGINRTTLYRLMKRLEPMSLAPHGKFNLDAPALLS